MNDLRDTIITIFLVALLTTMQVNGILAPRKYQIMDEVMAIRLIGDCELMYIICTGISNEMAGEALSGNL